MHEYESRGLGVDVSLKLGVCRVTGHWMHPVLTCLDFTFYLLCQCTHRSCLHPGDGGLGWAVSDNCVGPNTIKPFQKKLLLLLFFESVVFFVECESRFAVD